MRNIAIYIAADNNLSEYAKKDIVEMERIGSSSSLQIWVQVDFSGKENTKKYLIQRSNKTNPFEINSPNLAPDGYEINTGDPNELNNFLMWSLGNNIATQSSLILWGHGTGWRPPGKYTTIIPSLFNHQSLLEEFGIKTAEGKGYGVDFTDGYAALDVLQIDRILKIYRKGGDKFDFIGFDACLMASIEVAYQLIPHSNFLVVSASEEPSEGWPYHRVIEILSSEQQPISECLKQMADAYVQSYLPGEDSQVADRPVTISVINLENIPNLVRNISSFANLAIELLAKKAERYYFIFSKAKSLAQIFKLTSYIDLASYLWRIEEKLSPDLEPDDEQLVETIHQVHSALQNSVFKRSIDDHPDYKLKPHGGLSIYFPPRAYEENHILRIAYEKLEFYKAMPEWWNFILKYYE